MYAIVIVRVLALGVGACGLRCVRCLRCAVFAACDLRLAVCGLTVCSLRLNAVQFTVLFWIPLGSSLTLFLCFDIQLLTTVLDAFLIVHGC